MVTIGNDTLPGTITTIESNVSTGVNVGAPGTPVLVGRADLSSGTATADTAEKVATPVNARKLFGDGSQLANAVTDALSEGAYPVYAVPATVTSVSGEDLSGVSSDTTTLVNAPLVEDASTISVTVNSTTKTPVLVYDDDPSNLTPGTDEALINPITGKMHVDETMGNTGDSIDYEYQEFSGAFDEVRNASFSGDNLQEIVDFVVSLNENDTVVDDLQTTVGEMENDGALAIGLAGAGDPYIGDTSTYTNNYDDSRMQLYYPSRNDSDETIMGSLAGLRSRFGISDSPMFSRIATQKDLRVTITRSQQEDLVGERVNPIRDQSGGALIVEDLTTVDTSTNLEEKNFDQGIARLVTDYVAEYSNEQAELFIGELHTRQARNALRAIIVKELRKLLSSNAITAFSLVVDRVDANTASLDVGIETIEPLRNIETTITAGAVQTGGGA